LDNWSAMFEEVRCIVRQGLPLSESLFQVIEFANSNPALCDEPEYWRQVKSHEFRPAFDTMIGWGKAGLVQIAPSKGWEFLLLDLGDCPETFRLYSPGGQKLMSDLRLRVLLSQKLVIEAGAFEECFATTPENSFNLLFRNAQDFADHHVSELNDDILDWTGDTEDADDHGNNGCLLWLLLGSLALLSPFNDSDYCRQTLQGRDKLYLLSGFESLFTHLATVTAAGLVYEEVGTGRRVVSGTKMDA